MKNNIKDALWIGVIIGAIYFTYYYYVEGFISLDDPLSCIFGGIFIGLGACIIGIILYPLVWVLLWVARHYGWWQGIDYPEKGVK